MNEGQDGASAHGQLSMDQLQQELHAKDLLLETLRYENNNLKQYSDRRYDPASSSPDWKSYDALKRKVVEYQKAVEQRDHIIGQMEAGIKQLMHKNMESEAKARKAEEHYSGEIQTLAQQVQELTTQLSITSHQHQATMRAAQDHFTQQLTTSQQHMREEHESEVTELREKHEAEMARVTVQVETLEKSQREEHLKLVEHLTHLSSTLGEQLEEEKEKVLGLQREKEEWEVHKKELEAESEERRSLRRSLEEHITVREALQEQLRRQVERQAHEEGKVESLHKASESLSQDLKAEKEQRNAMEVKLEVEMQNARKLFEQKTELEVNQKQMALQLLVAEEELARTAAARVSDAENLESLGREKEALARESEALAKDKEALIRENMNLTSEKEGLKEDKKTLLSETEALTKEKEGLTSDNEMLTKDKESIALLTQTLTKEKETLASDYKILTKEKEAIALEKSRVLADKKLKEKENERLVKELEALTAVKDSLMEERQELIKEKNDFVAEKALWTSEKETLLRETEAWATEKESLLTEKENLLMEKKNSISEKEALVQENATLKQQLEILSSEKEMEAKDKERLTTHVDTLMTEKNILAKENSDLITEKNFWIKEKETLLQRIETWTREKDDLLSEKEGLLSEKREFLTEKETWENEKTNWSRKEESLNKTNESLNAEKEILSGHSKELANMKEQLIQQNKSLSHEKESLIEEKESLTKQVNRLTAEKDSLVQRTEEFAQKNADLTAEKESLTRQMSVLRREKEAAHYGEQVTREALEEEVRSLREAMEAGQADRKHSEEKCARKEAEVKELKEQYSHLLELKDCNFKELEESYKKKFQSKDLQLQELEENFKEKFSLKEKEMKDIEELHGKKCLQKDRELKELSDQIASKESELQELREKDRGMEKLRENCFSLLERLQSGEEERKRIEEECEDKCEVLNAVLRNIDVKLFEAAALVSRQQGVAEAEMQEARPRSHLDKPHTGADTGKETQPVEARESEAAVERDESEREKERHELLEELCHVKGKLLEGRRKEEDLTERLTLSEKEKKQHAVEAEEMSKKIHDQHLAIALLQDEKSQLGKHVAQLEGERSTLRAEETQHLKGNMRTQGELSALRVTVTAQKQKLALHEEKVKKINEALTAVVQEDCPEKLRQTAISLNCLLSESESFVRSEDGDAPCWLSVLCQDLETQWKQQCTILEQLIDLQQHTDNLQLSKMHTDLENITLSAEVDRLKHVVNQADAGTTENVNEVPEAKEGSENGDLVLRRLKGENAMLRQCLSDKSIMLRLERLHLLSPKPNFEREVSLCVRERKVVMQVVKAWLERFVDHCRLQAETHPSVPVFADALAAHIEYLSSHLLCLSKGQDLSGEVVVKCLQQAVVRSVSQEYKETVTATLGSLEQELSHVLHHITQPALSLHASVEETRHQQTTEETSLLQWGTPSFDPQELPQDLTAKVEHLINVRTALVDAANEFYEELEEVLGQRLALLKEQLQSVNEPKDWRQEHTREIEQLRQKHREEVQRLEAQLAARDQEALQHLQGLYSDRDWYKKTVGLLSHVTLQLLHYYSVAQSLTRQSQPEPPSPPPHPVDSPTPGRVLDLSFLSDCVGGEEEEEMLAFSEDRALATGLMGRTAVGMEGEMVDDGESALDGTAVSEGMMDDLDKDEQVRTLLERSYPQLMAILKGRWDRVLVTRLEKEVQELTISLQASAGMLRIFIHSVSSNENDLFPHTPRDEAQEESVENPVQEAAASGHAEESNEQKRESELTCDPHPAVQQTPLAKDTTALSLASIGQEDFSCISEGLVQLLSQEESLSSFTMLATHNPQDKEQLRALLRQLCEAAQASASLKLDLHHAQGLLQGLEEERHNLQEEVSRLTHYSKNLARELQVLKDQLEEAGPGHHRPVSHYTAKMEATKDVRERVRAALSAKNVAELERGQLEARVRELEGLLEEVVRESEAALEALRTKEIDLSQQLEVADRQLKSARQFLEEHASERDQEVEELVAARDRLTVQLREREAQLSLQAAQEREICDLREIIQSLESQVDGHCLKEAELSEQVEALSGALALAQQQAQHLSSKVDELRPLEGEQDEAQGTDAAHSGIPGDKAEGNTCQHGASLLSELQEDVLSTSVMYRLIERRLRDTTRGLEAMQLSGSVEDISAQEVEVTVVDGEGRLSPSTVDRRLEDQLVALECTTEAAIKRNKDLQLTIKNLQAEYEEVSAERDTLQECSREQLVKISGLEARLDEVRRADHPAAARMRQRLAQLQEDLEEKRTQLTKKSRETEELKHSLSSLREQLTNREGELQQLQSASFGQPHSLPQTAHDHLEEQLAHKTLLLESLQKDLTEARQQRPSSSSLSPSLAEDLISDKNAEIAELSTKVEVLQCAIKKAYVLVRAGGNLCVVKQVLSDALGKALGDVLDESEEEVLRREEPEQMPSLVYGSSGKETAEMQVSAASLQTSAESGEASTHTQPLVTDLSLVSAQNLPPPELLRVSQGMDGEQPGSQLTPVSRATPSPYPGSQRAASPHSRSPAGGGITLSREEYEAVCSANMEVTVHKAHIELLTQEIQSLNDYQARLEEDFRSAQELLEAREAEILQLTEEVEDAPPTPLPTPVPLHPDVDLKEVTSRLREQEEQVDHLSSALQRKNEEVQQLSTQLEQVHAEMKERLSHASREAARLEEQFQQEILDLKEQHVAQEKRLCRDYEERMAKQVEDVAQHITRNKEAAMARQQEVFEAALRQAAMERDQAMRELEQCRAAPPPPSPPPPPPQAHPPHQQTAQLCASVDALIAGLKQELEKAGQLDLSMASLMKGGESGEASTRASSTLSDASDGEEPATVNGRIQHLMGKIHKEGIEVLTLIDIMFLCKHCSQLDTSQRSVLSSSSLIASSLLEKGGAGKQAQLMHNLVAAEEELTKKEQEMKRKIGVLEFQLEQERMSGSEWKLSFQSEKQHTWDLMEQLRRERLSGAEQVSELTLLRSQLLIVRLQHQKLQEENCSLTECQEKKYKQIESLQAALQAERSNFSRVSKVLSEERKVSSLTHSEQEAIIKDLRVSLEKERERIVSLCSHLERMSSQQSSLPPPTTTAATTTTPTQQLKTSVSSKPTAEELQVQLAVERERLGELERAFERERLQAASQKEQASAERSQAKVEVRKAEGRLAELMRTVRSLETEKQRLARQISHERERLQHQDSRIKELEGEARRLEADSRAQSEAHQAMSDKMREEGTQLHLAYTRTLTKLGEAEAEVCELRHKLRTTNKELQLSQEQEEQLKQDLHTERTAADRMALPALFRMMNPDGCSDAQLKGNLELCRSVLRLTDDQRALRTHTAQLEDTVASLNQQLRQAQEAKSKTSNFEELLKAERQAWETERASLQYLNQQLEAEAGRSRPECNTQDNTQGTAEMQQLYGRYIQSEHWRKALVWQKQYLMLVIKGYSDTEQHTLARLTAMAPLQVFPSSTQHRHTSHSKGRFRVAVLVVVALCRMKHLVVRFHRKKRLCMQVHVVACSTASTPENSRPESVSSRARGREAWPTTPQAANQGVWASSFTGLTPPTREHGTTTTHRPSPATHRKLFQEDSEELNQYVERLDNIHSVLGLTNKKQ